MESSSSKPAESPIHRIFIDTQTLPKDDGTNTIYQAESGELHRVFGIMDFDTEVPTPEGYIETKAILVKTKKRALKIFLPAP